MKALDLITTEELAAMCRVTPSTVRYWKYMGTGPKSFHLNNSKRVFYTRADVEEWINEQYAKAHPETAA